jgi:hypothetical protein
MRRVLVAFNMKIVCQHQRVRGEAEHERMILLIGSTGHFRWLGNNIIIRHVLPTMKC